MADVPTEREGGKVPTVEIALRAEQEAPLTTTTRTYAVRQPEAERHEFIIHVHASTLKRCRAKLATIRRARFPFGELFLALAMLGFGSTLSALASDVKLDSNLGRVFYVAIPPASVAAGIAYAFLRNRSLREPSDIAEDVLNDLPDPDKTS